MNKIHFEMTPIRDIHDTDHKRCFAFINVDVAMMTKSKYEPNTFRNDTHSLSMTPPANITMQM